MRTMVSEYGAKINVVKHILLRNGWEYYVTDNKFDEDTIQCLVMGFETELGDVYLPELKGFKLSETTNLDGLAPAPGWKWE